MKRIAGQSQRCVGECTKPIYMEKKEKDLVTGRDAWPRLVLFERRLRARTTIFFFLSNVWDITVSGEIYLSTKWLRIQCFKSYAVQVLRYPAHPTVTLMLALSSAFGIVKVRMPSFSFAATLLPSTGRGIHMVREKVELPVKNRSEEIWFEMGSVLATSPSRKLSILS